MHSAAAAHDAWLTSRDPGATLKAAAAMWAVSILGRLLSAWRLLALCSILAFTVPAAVDANRHRLDRAWRDASRAVQVGWAEDLERPNCNLGRRVALGLTCGIRGLVEMRQQRTPGVDACNRRQRLRS